MSLNKWEPNKILKSHVERAAKYWLKQGTYYPFHDSSTYDVLIGLKRFPPKAVVGKAHEYATGRMLQPSEFVGAKNGVWHKCLIRLGFAVVKKSGSKQLRKNCTEAEAEEGFTKDRTVEFKTRNAGLIKKRKEKDSNTCQSCKFQLFVNGKAIIDCHHLFPLSASVDPTVTKINQLVCLCPTCHRIAHSTNPPLTPSKIRKLLKI